MREASEWPSARSAQTSGWPSGTVTMSPHRFAKLGVLVGEHHEMDGGGADRHLPARGDDLVHPVHGRLVVADRQRHVENRGAVQGPRRGRRGRVLKRRRAEQRQVGGDVGRGFRLGLGGGHERGGGRRMARVRGVRTTAAGVACWKGGGGGVASSG